MDERGAQAAIRRFFAVVWLLHNEMLLSLEVREDGRNIPMALDRLGKFSNSGCTRYSMSVLAQRFGDRFNFCSRVQKRASARDNYARSGAKLAPKTAMAVNA